MSAAESAFGGSNGGREFGPREFGDRRARDFLFLR